ncbi:unnamed protein product [Arctia plantaginis]|uniref:Uncharacterized protein n=1 Tax=Arctia plantaginis TaxID=874455 RepID=A0A8S0ZVK1_ARCPL|nr:unnamed protein product [Arctia plantaginis]
MRNRFNTQNPLAVSAFNELRRVQPPAQDVHRSTSQPSPALHSTPTHLATSLPVVDRHRETTTAPHCPNKIFAGTPHSKLRCDTKCHVSNVNIL